jgi:hypothetical protein
MVLRAARESVNEQNDLDDIESHFEKLRERVSSMDNPVTP